MDDKFHVFQIEEYKNISNAHFETNKQIGIFFRYFLLIASAPALIFLWFGKDNPNFINNLLNGNEEVLNINVFIGFFLIFISIINVFSSFYLISLKLDNILYARTINGIRKYFYNAMEFPNDEHYRVLPKQTNIPSYFDNHTFGVLYYAIAIINSAYFSLGLRIISGVGEPFFQNYFHVNPVFKNFNIWSTIFVFIILFILHIWYYLIVSKYRRVSYLKCRIIGIDIDGVLNKHRETFCNIHQENLKIRFNDNIPKGKNLKPEEITRIPVSAIEGKTINEDDEYDVFNSPKYWEEQELIEDNVAKIIKKIKNDFGYKVFLHSYRPWPQTTYGNLAINKYSSNKDFNLSTITERWLKTNRIAYDKLYIERNGIDTSKRSITIMGLILGASINSFTNRFYYTAKRPYRYFVEDDLDNAIKLSMNCEYVFLVDQPYNQIKQEKLPNNIIRVKSWKDIKSEIKRLG